MCTLLVEVKKTLWQMNVGDMAGSHENVCDMCTRFMFA